jgi:hypothetical protein
MIHNAKRGFVPRPNRVALFVVACGLFGSGWGAYALAQKSPAKAVNAHAEAEASQQPLYSDYRGVRIGTSTEEARAKLGEPKLKADDQDYYVISEKETAQICYDAAHKVMAISVDYLGEGSGAPDYKAVVGPDITTKPDGSKYQIVYYDNLGFWVSYNRTNGDPPVISITIQKTIK